MNKIKVAIFASGNGSNAEAIIQHFKNHPKINVSGIYSNNPKAYVLERAANHGISSHVFSKKEFTSEAFCSNLKEEGYDLLVLAGFMWLIPPALVTAFNNKIVNIHPALLPSYGGKGMYGAFVHKAIIKNQEKESGITIHYVNERYDDGDIIFQAKCEVSASDTPESLAARVHLLEHKNYPLIIEEVCKNNF